MVEEGNWQVRAVMGSKAQVMVELVEIVVKVPHL